MTGMQRHQGKPWQPLLWPAFMALFVVPPACVLLAIWIHPVHWLLTGVLSVALGLLLGAGNSFMLRIQKPSPTKAGTVQVCETCCPIAPGKPCHCACHKPAQNGGVA